MKRLKVFVAALTLAVVAIGFSSFTVKSYHSKVFDLTCRYYVGTTPIHSDASQQVAGEEAAFRTAGNWSTTPPTGGCPDGDFLCAICYDPSGEAYSSNFSGGAGTNSVLDRTWNARFSWGHNTQIPGTDNTQSPNDGDTDGIVTQFKP